MDNENPDHLINMCHQSMIEIEGSLSELKETVFTWLLLTSEGLKPYQGLIVEHLEEMLSQPEIILLVSIRDYKNLR